MDNLAWITLGACVAFPLGWGLCARLAPSKQDFEKAANHWFSKAMAQENEIARLQRVIRLAAGVDEETNMETPPDFMRPMGVTPPRIEHKTRSPIGFGTVAMSNDPQEADAEAAEWLARIFARDWSKHPQ